MTTETRTDSERLEFLVSQGYDCSAISSNPNYRAVIDRSMEAWDARLYGISRRVIHPNAESGRFADKDHPRGYNVTLATMLPQTPESEMVGESRAALDASAIEKHRKERARAFAQWELATKPYEGWGR